MFIVLFALVPVVGSWLALRRHPMYSSRSSLRGALAALLMVVAATALMIGVANVAARQSPAARMAMMLGTVLVAAVGITVGMIKLVTPKQEVLPSTATTTHFHRKKLTVWAKRWVGSMLIVAVLAWRLPGAYKGIAYGLGIILALLGVVMLSAGYYAARNQDRSLTALMYHPWVHWRYSAAQWQDWIDARVAGAQKTSPLFIVRRDWWKVTLACVGITACTFGFGSGWRFNTAFSFSVSAILVTMIVISTRKEKHSPAVLRAKLVDCEPEAYFGEEGVFCDGALIPWVSADDWLLAASVDEIAPRNLLLCFEKINAGNAAVPTSRVNQRVLLPAAAESDLARLQKELEAKCTTARVLLC